MQGAPDIVAHDLRHPQNLIFPKFTRQTAHVPHGMRLLGPLVS